MRHLKVYRLKRSRLNRPWTIRLSHGTRYGAPVLKEQSSWRNVNGVGIFLPWRQVWITLEAAA